MEGRSVLLVTAGLLQLMLSVSADVVPMYPPYTTASPELLEHPLCQRAAYESPQQWLMESMKVAACKSAFQMLLTKMAPIGSCGVFVNIFGGPIMRNEGLDQILTNYQGVNYNPAIFKTCKLELALRDKGKNLLTKITKSGEAVGEKLDAGEIFDNFVHFISVLRP